MIPMVPIGTRIRWNFRPLGWVCVSITCPTGSGRSATARTASAMPDSRASSSASRSSSAVPSPRAAPAARSCALAARIAGVAATSRSAARCRACARAALGMAASWRWASRASRASASTNAVQSPVAADRGRRAVSVMARALAALPPAVRPTREAAGTNRERRRRDPAVSGGAMTVTLLIAPACTVRRDSASIQPSRSNRDSTLGVCPDSGRCVGHR